MNTAYGIGDIGMVAFWVLFMQSPSFLAQQRQFEEGYGRSTANNLFGIAKIPTGNHIRDMLDAVYLGDDLVSRQPLCLAVLDAGGHFLFVWKRPRIRPIQEYLTGVDLPMLEQAVKRGKQRFVHRYRWLRGVSLLDGRDALAVNRVDIDILNASAEVAYRNSFVTDLPVELAACGRARWKIENKTSSALKNNDYNLDHSSGRRKKNLAAALAGLNLLAFAIHTVGDISDEPWRAARAMLGPH